MRSAAWCVFLLLTFVTRSAIASDLDDYYAYEDFDESTGGIGGAKIVQCFQNKSRKMFRDLDVALNRFRKYLYENRESYPELDPIFSMTETLRSIKDALKALVTGGGVTDAVPAIAAVVIDLFLAAQKALRELFSGRVSVIEFVNRLWNFLTLLHDLFTGSIAQRFLNQATPRVKEQVKRSVDELDYIVSHSLYQYKVCVGYLVPTE